MAVLRLLLLAFLVVFAVMIFGCSSTKSLEFVQYTDYERLDRLSADRIQVPGRKLVIDAVTTRSNSEPPGELSDYLWAASTSISYDSEKQYERLGASKRHQYGFLKLPIKEVQKFFTDAVTGRLKAAGEKDIHVSLDVKKVMLTTWDVGLEKYRACKIIVGIKSGTSEIVASSEIKMQDSFTKYISSDYTTKQVYFDPKGLDVVELAYVDALQNGLSQLNK